MGVDRDATAVVADGHCVISMQLNLDAVGMTWRFEPGNLRFDLDGFSLLATDPGATMTFTESGVELRGFELMPL